MTPVIKLQSILHQLYTAESGDQFIIEWEPALTDEQIGDFAAQLPGGQVPDDIKELLLFTPSFKFLPLDIISFVAIDQFGLKNIFPHCIQLASDGFKNFWVLDINSNGDWGAVYYVCHDPGVVVKHSTDLTEFIMHVDEYGVQGKTSNLHIIHEKTVLEVWKDKGGFIEREVALASDDEVLKNFAASLPVNFVIADLRGKANRSGFAWGRFGKDNHTAVRHATELLWGVEQKEGFFKKLFGGG